MFWPEDYKYAAATAGSFQLKHSLAQSMHVLLTVHGLCTLDVLFAVSDN